MRMLFSCVLAAALSMGVAAAQQPTQSVLTYHGALDRSGLFVVPGLTAERARSLHLDTAFDAKIEGRTYAQPLFWLPKGTTHGLIIVATENDTVYALDALSGAQVWKRVLGEPVRQGDLPCGNIFPLGVTGTPVIDEANAAVYLDAAVRLADGVRHEMFALFLADGVILRGWPVDVGKIVGTEFSPSTQNQRGALAIFGGKVFAPFSGLWGDCDEYHGRVIAITTSGAAVASNFATRAHGGGIWGQGGVTSDGNSLFAATGNTMGADAWGDGEAVLRFAPDLARPVDKRDFFAPSDWRHLDDRDLDLGGTAPLPLNVPVRNGTRPLILAIGKNGFAYLLDRASLGGIGGELTSRKVTTNVAVSGPATWPAPDGALVALQGNGAACPGTGAKGLIALKVVASPQPAIDFAWCADVAGDGSPIVTTTDGRSDAIVWVVGAGGDNKLHAFSGQTGAPIVSSAPMRGLHHFQTLIATADHIYVAADGTVYAFAF
jgi:PQQ-like domain